MRKGLADNLIDTHCHILPGVDDGAQNIKETLDVLRAASADGIRTMIATPHYHPKKGHMKAAQIREVFENVVEAKNRAKIPIELYLGQEIYYGSDLPYWLKDGDCITVNGSNIAFVEFPKGCTISHMYSAVKRLRKHGYRTLISHVESYDDLRVDIEEVKALADLGTLFQVNAATILGEAGMASKRFAYELMEEDLLTCVGTDLHHGYTNQLQKVYLKLGKKFGSFYAQCMMVENARDLFGLDK